MHARSTRFMPMVIMIAGLLSGSMSSVSAQILGTGTLPVIEVGPALTNQIITAAQTGYTVANQILDLTPVDELIVGARVTEDLITLAEIVSQAQGLAADLASLNAQIRVLLDLETAPRTRSALDARLLELRRLVYDGRVYALRTQTLITTTMCTIDHLLGLLQSVTRLIGNMQANQRLLEAQATISKTLAVQTTITTAWQRSDVVERLSADLVKTSMGHIADQQLAGWPQWER